MTSIQEVAWRVSLAAVSAATVIAASSRFGAQQRVAEQPPGDFTLLDEEAAAADARFIDALRNAYFRKKNSGGNQP